MIWSGLAVSNGSSTKTADCKHVGRISRIENIMVLVQVFSSLESVGKERVDLTMVL